MSFLRWYLPPSLIMWATVAAVVTVTSGLALGAMVAVAYTVLDELGLN